jgi:hypothetical protein
MCIFGSQNLIPSADNTNLVLDDYRYQAQPHPIIVNYFIYVRFFPSDIQALLMPLLEYTKMKG